MKLLLASLLLLNTYFGTYPHRAQAALDFWQQHPECCDSLRLSLSDNEMLFACAIVSPEVSQYSQLEDIAQFKAMALVYILHAQGDYSIGYFQMKPSFAARIETLVGADKELLRRHAPLIISYSKEEDPDGRRKRHDRLDRLTNLGWQVRYLAAFVDIVKQKTASTRFKDDNEKLRYWATLYNAGVDSSPSRVASCMKKKQFPRRGERFNYADVTVEFYNKIRETKIIK